MGDIAEMMLNGAMCESCGEVLGGSAPGYPRYCRSCRPSAGRGGIIEYVEYAKRVFAKHGLTLHVPAPGRSKSQKKRDQRRRARARNAAETTKVAP